MKKYILILLTSVVTLSSCSDWFDVTSGSEIREKDHYSTLAGFQQSLIGCYISMTDNALYGKELSWYAIEILGHQFNPVTSNSSNSREMQEYENFNYDHTQIFSDIENIWAKAYSVIANANEALTNMEGQESSLNEVYYHVIKGELLAIRAYMHFDLLRLYGYGDWKNRSAELNSKKTIPYVTTLSSIPTPQRTGKETLQMIINDLEAAEKLLKEQLQVIGIDNLNDYYDVRLKEERLKKLDGYTNFKFIRMDIADAAAMKELFEREKPDIVVNLAAQAGVRYSITNPDAYIQSNLIGFYNVLECCRHSYDDGNTGVKHLVFASSSSVYGANKKVPYSTEDQVDHPVSLYAATKKSNELLAYSYGKLYGIPVTGLRFFTVYGPMGRPDMAYFGFTNKLRAGDTIQIFNYGNCKRDFTYVDDFVEGVKRVMQAAPEKKNGEDGLPIPPYAVYNIGNSHPEILREFVDILQQELISAGVLPEDYDFDAHKK